MHYSIAEEMQHTIHVLHCTINSLTISLAFGCVFSIHNHHILCNICKGKTLIQRTLKDRVATSNKDQYGNKFDFKLMLQKRFINPIILYVMY